MQNTKEKYLILDISNILYKTFYVNRREEFEYLTPLAFTSTFAMIQKLYKIHKPDKIIMCFDSPNWRKDYTLSDACYSKKVYKGHRRKSMTPSEQQLYDKFKEFIDDFKKVINICTTFISIYADGLECDDLVAGLCTIYGGESTYPEYGHKYSGEKFDKELILISDDSDYIQLLQFPNVKLFKSSNGQEVLIDDHGSVDKFIFMKSMTGDSSDNIPRVKPRLMKRIIEDAYNDPFKLTNLLQEKWSDIDDREICIQDLYNENRMLIDLTNQPLNIQELMWNTIEEFMSMKRVYNHFRMIQFIGKYELKMVEQYLNSYKPMMML